MFVNYVREINAFNRFANDNYLSSSERLLWFGLMDYVNLHFASGAEWPGEFISVPNKSLLSHVPFGEDALIDARNRLKQRGLLDYIPGKKNKEAPKYKIHYFAASQLSTGYQHDSTFYTEKTGNVPVNVPGKVPGNVQGNIPGNMPGRPTNINLNVNPNVNHNVDSNLFDDVVEEDADKTRARVREAVDSAFRQNYGRSATIAEANRISLVFVHLGMDIDVLHEAVKIAAQNGARNPAPYVIRLLSEWETQYIQTVTDLEDYLAMYQMHIGNTHFPANTVTYSELEEERQRRRAAKEAKEGC